MLQTQTAHRGAVGVDDMCQEPFLDQISTVDEDGVPHQEAHSRDSLLGMFLVLFYYFVLLHPAREYFAKSEMSPLPVTGC